MANTGPVSCTTLRMNNLWENILLIIKSHCFFQSFLDGVPLLMFFLWNFCSSQTKS